MNQQKGSQELFVKYLLGMLPDDEKSKFEDVYFENEELYEELQDAEYDLIDKYVRDELSKEEREKFELHFLFIPGKREKMESAKSLKEYIMKKKSRPNEQTVVEIKPPVEIKPLGDKRQPSQNSHFRLYLKMAASFAFISILALGTWYFFFKESEVNKGMAALVASYQNSRPLESRITAFNYAPFLYYKDGASEQKNAEPLSLKRAERILLDAVDENPSFDSHHALGRFYLAKREINKAIEYLEIALSESSDNAQLHNDLGIAFLEQGKSENPVDKDNNLLGKKMAAFGKSLEHFNKAIELDSTLLDAFFNKALLFQEMKQFDKAKEAWEEYLKKDSSSPWSEEARDKLKLLDKQKQEGHLKTPEENFQDFSNAFTSQNSDKAWQSIKQARDRKGNFIVEKLLDSYLGLIVQERREEARLQLQMLFYAGLIEEQKTQDHFISDLSFFYSSITPKQAKLLSDARKTMVEAKDYYDKSEFGRAIKTYSKAKKLFELSENNCEILFAENWIGNCYLRIPDTKQSFSIFQSLSEIFKKKNYKWLLSQALNSISDAQFSLNEFSSAIDTVNQALLLSQHIQDIGTTLRNLQQLTTIQLSFGNYYQSLGYIFQAFELINAFPVRLEAKQTWPFYQEISKNYYKLELFTAALEFQQKALNLAMESNFPLIKSRSYALLGLIYGKIKNYDKAIESGQSALEEARNVDNKSQSNIIANSTLNLAYIYRQIGNYNKSIEYSEQAIELYEKLKVPFWFYESHKGRLLALIGLHEILEAKKELSNTITLFENYRSKILEESNRNSFFDKNQDIYDIAMDFTYFKLGDTQTAFQYSEDSHARSLLDLINDLNNKKSRVNIPTTIDNKFKNASLSLQLNYIQEQIPEQVQILQYSILDNKILMWVVSKNTFTSNYTEIDSSVFNERVSSYLHLISAKSENLDSISVKNKKEEIVNLAKELYKDLIKPIELLLTKDKQIYIVPDKSLHYLPFGTLISPDSGKYFIEDYAIATAPSSSTFLICSNKAQTKEQMRERILAVGNPTLDLSASERETEQIVSLYKQSIPLIRENAREAQVRNEMQKANIVHLSSHYFIGENSPMLSKILLAQEPTKQQEKGIDGLLQAFEVYQFKLTQTKLVILSACQTGIDRTYSGEGAVSMARSFISAGVPIIIASLWPVEADSSSELMISFHKYRKQKGFSTIEALRQAQLDMLKKTDGFYQHPHFWAPFTIVGGYTKF